MGFLTTTTWAPDFPNARSLAFVKAFEAAYGYVPGNYAAHSYDTAFLIDSAVRAGPDKAAIRAAMERADFPSVRGKFTFGRNHYPVSNIVLAKVIKRPDGKYATATVRTVLADDVDSYAAQCAMPA